MSTATATASKENKTATSTRSSSSNSNPNLSLSTKCLAETALAMVRQDWNLLGLDEQRPAGERPQHPATLPTSDTAVLVHRVTAVLAARCCAVVADSGYYQTLSCRTVCTMALQYGEWPLSKEAVQQLNDFARRMLTGYKAVPYHNQEHAYHVVLSMVKLIEMMVSSGSKTYGLKHDPLALLALLFAALCHDVEHQGIPNRQLALEDDRLAVLYNDQSMAEHWSLYVAFSEFLQDEFADWRKSIVPEDADYRRFRKLVVNLVLCTDIASPERTQIGKSKWKEAFGDPFETVERKLRERRNSMTGRIMRRGSAASAISSFGKLSMDEEEGDDSLSGTPDPSESGDLNDSEKMSYLSEYGNGSGGNGAAAQQQRQQQQQQPPLSKAFAKLERRMSATSVQSNKYRQRLGILRTVDLSGETLETYERRGSMTSCYSASVVVTEQDDPDDLKATVVMETLMTAADVAHNLQGWDHMILWSGRLYMELRRAYVSERGMDPREKWAENQIGFLQSYLMPMAHRLEDTGVFGETQGQMFAATVEENRERWLTEGYDEAMKVVAAGNKRYPLQDKNP